MIDNLLPEDSYQMYWYENHLSGSVTVISLRVMWKPVDDGNYELTCEFHCTEEKWGKGGGCYLFPIYWRKESKIIPESHFGDVEKRSAEESTLSKSVAKDSGGYAYLLGVEPAAKLSFAEIRELTRFK